eukprot:4559877-Pleurochrysis_carterae.AAC.5
MQSSAAAPEQRAHDSSQPAQTPVALSRNWPAGHSSTHVSLLSSRSMRVPAAQTSQSPLEGNLSTALGPEHLSQDSAHEASWVDPSGL